MKLNASNLEKIHGKWLSKPTYDRSKIKNLILHIGPGNFHRSHQAYLTDLANEKSSETWGVFGVSFLSKKNDLSENDNLYSLMMMSATETKVRIVQTITGHALVSESAEAIISKGASNDVKIISLTITEKGYPQNSFGNLDTENFDVKNEMQNLDHPLTGIGLIVAILKKRFETNKESKVTVLSCDNIQHNGVTTRNLVFQMSNIISADLAEWVERNVTFPSCVVDRITPKAEAADIKRLENDFGIIDAKMVKSEDFIQWVIEDNFAAGRPKWESAGAIFTSNIDNIEKLKLRILNGAHSALAYYGLYQSHAFVHEAVGNPFLNTFVKEFMDEITNTLCPSEVKIEDYKETVLKRFANPNIQDTLERIVLDSSTKLKEFIIPSIEDLQRYRLKYNRCVEVIAAWIQFARDSKFPYTDLKKAALQALPLTVSAKEFLLTGLGKSVSENAELGLKVELLLEMFKKEGIVAIIEKH